VLIALGALSATTVSAQNARIIQTNSRDTTVHLIDPQTQSIVGEIGDIPIPHGAAARALDGLREA
jgi:hypothetical protein